VKRMIFATGTFVALLSTAACSNLSSTDQRVLSGTGIGAAAGTVGALIVQGNPIIGLVGGAAVGAATGYMVDKQSSKSSK